MELKYVPLFLHLLQIEAYAENVIQAVEKSR